MQAESGPEKAAASPEGDIDLEPRVVWIHGSIIYPFIIACLPVLTLMTGCEEFQLGFCEEAITLQFHHTIISSNTDKLARVDLQFCMARNGPHYETNKQYKR